MKLVKTANGKSTIKLSKKEWETIGKQAGWFRQASDLRPDELDDIARKIFPKEDAMTIENIVNSVLKDNPTTQEEAIEKIKDERKLRQMLWQHETAREWEVNPHRLLERALIWGLIDIEEATSERFREAALEIAEDINDTYKDSGWGIGSSDITAFVGRMLNNAGVQTKVENYKLERVR